MKLIYATVLLAVGCALADNPSQNPETLVREKKDISKLQYLLGLKGKQLQLPPPSQEYRPVYAPLCNCWRPARPYSGDGVVVYPRPAVVVPAQPALVAPPRAQSGLVIPAAPAVSVHSAPEPCPPGYSYDRPAQPLDP